MPLRRTELDEEGRPGLTVASALAHRSRRGAPSARERRIDDPLDRLLPIRPALRAIVDLSIVAVHGPDDDSGAGGDRDRCLEVFLVDRVRDPRIVVQRVRLPWAPRPR